MLEPHRHDLLCSNSRRGSSGRLGTGIDGGKISAAWGFDSRVLRKIGKAKQSRPALLAPTLASMIRWARHPIGDRVDTAHVGLDHPVDHESRRDVDAVPAGIPAVPLYLAVEIGDCKGLGKLHAAIALDPPDDVVERGIEVRPA